MGYFKFCEFVLSVRLPEEDLARRHEGIMQKNFTLDFGWQLLIKDLGLDIQDVLRTARLPLDMPNSQRPSLTAQQYYSMWKAMESQYSGDTFALDVVSNLGVEACSPPVFAALCAENLSVGLNRLAQYKPLIGPFSLKIEKSPKDIKVQMSGLPNGLTPPSSLLAAELVFLVRLARLGTREQIVPMSATTQILPEFANRYEDFIGTRIRTGSATELVFSIADATRPFMTQDESMWNVFEPELRRRMRDLNETATFRERVKACLNEGLAGGHHSIEDVAQRLGVSPRTLQRRLNEENSSFQQELNSLRESLARHYLTNTTYRTAEIAFLIGYNEPNSFFRAFHDWTGKTPDEVRTGT